MSIYNRIKNKPIVKKLESLSDPNFSKFVSNVVREFPKFKGKEQELSSKGLTLLKNPENFIQSNQGQIDKIANSQLTEQIASQIILTTFGLLLLMLVVYSAKYGKKINTPAKEEIKIRKEELSEVNRKLQVLKGKTVNLYNDQSEQILYGTETVSDIEFFDLSKSGGRSGVKFGLGYQLQKISPDLGKVYGIYEIICLSNPERLADYIVREGEYISNYKYNKKFTDAVGAIAGSYCKAPSADFSVIQKPSNNKIA
jgi:hypothetical protein